MSKTRTRALAEQITRAIEDLTYARDNLHTYLDKLNDYEARGFTSSENETGRSSKGGAPGGLPIGQRDEIRDARMDWLKTLAQITHLSRASRAHISWMIVPTHHDVGRESRVHQCANPSCLDDLILEDGQVPDSGRCSPCADFRRRNGRDASAKVIGGRRLKREQRQQAS